MSEEINETLEGASKPKFGITKDTKAVNTVPMLPPTKLEVPTSQFPTGWKFPIGRLVNVVFNPAYETKNGNKVVIQFIFKDKEKRQYTHTEWEIDANDAKFNDKQDWMASRIKHLYVAVFGSFPNETGIGTDANNWVEYFKAVAHAFNSVVRTINDKAVKAYSQVQLYIKLTFYKTNLGFPLAPNFVQRVEKDKPCKLTVKPSEKVEASTTKSNALPEMGGSTSTEDFPDFD